MGKYSFFVSYSCYLFSDSFILYTETVKTEYKSKGYKPTGTEETEIRYTQGIFPLNREDTHKLIADTQTVGRYAKVFPRS